MSSHDNSKAKEEALSSLKTGKFKVAAVRARALSGQFQDDFEYPLFLGIALMKLQNHEAAKNVLRHAVEKFPGEWLLHDMLGGAHEILGAWQRAEEEYRMALDLAGEAPVDAIAGIHCSIGDTLWARHNREGALAEWRKALEIDPRCGVAKECIKKFTNEYGEPKALDAIFDDLHHFQNIQTKRYLNLVGRDEFDTKEEAEEVIGVIMRGWNERVSPSSRKWDKMTAKEKTRLFESITLDFTEAVRRRKK